MIGEREQELRFVTVEEKEHYETLKSNLKIHNRISKSDVVSIMKHIVRNRTTFDQLVGPLAFMAQVLADCLPEKIQKFIRKGNETF